MNELGNILENYLDCTVYKTGKEKEEFFFVLQWLKLKKTEKKNFYKFI